MATVTHLVSSDLQRAADALKQVMEVLDCGRFYGTIECAVLRPKSRTFQLRITDLNVILLGATEKEALHTIAALRYGVQLGAGKI